MNIMFFILAIVFISSCSSDNTASQVSVYESIPVENTLISVSVGAAGVIEPEVTVDVKSEASGEVLAIYADTGDVVESGSLLVEIDQRTARNTLAQFEANLEASKARMVIAGTQVERAERLLESGAFTEIEHEQSQLEHANAKAMVVSNNVAVENARIALDDTLIRAPITGTVIDRQVELGTVISSSTQNVSGGSVLLRMADLNTVQVRALVDETDIGKINLGMEAVVTVAAYPNQPYRGNVLKIEPQALVEQNVTMFSILIRLENSNGLLLPGMNAEVEIQVQSRDNTPVIPTSALRTDSDIYSTSVMLGIEEEELRFLVSDVNRNDIVKPSRESMIEIQRKRSSGIELNKEEQLIFNEVRNRLSGMGIPSRSNEVTRSNYEYGGNYWVIAISDGVITPTPITTGITDFENSEVLSGLNINDSVLLLPSSSLFDQQQTLQRIVTNFSSLPFQQTSDRNTSPGQGMAGQGMVGQGRGGR